jgi:hypothetical protein
MIYEIQGSIVKIFDEQVFGENFKKREFVVKTKEDYPQEVKLEVTQKYVELLEDYSEGDEVFVKFNIKGKENKGNYYNNLSVWKIEKMKEGSEPAKKETKKSKPSFNKPESASEDLPF